MTTESHLVQSILAEFGALEGLRIWRANTGAARSRTGQLIRFGVPGQADISGILAPSGRRVEIEAKTNTGRQSRAQKNYQAMIEAHGGAYILAKSLDDVREGLERAGFRA